MHAGLRVSGMLPRREETEEEIGGKEKKAAGRLPCAAALERAFDGDSGASQVHERRCFVLGNRSGTERLPSWLGLVRWKK